MLLPLKSVKFPEDYCKDVPNGAEESTDLDRGYADEEYGACASHFHGNVHHLISPELISDLSNILWQPRFAQVYIFNQDNELQNRMTVAVNPDMHPGNMRLLQDMMHRMKPSVGLFKMIDDH